MKFGNVVDNLAKRFDRISPGMNNREEGISYWKDIMIIPLEDWTLLKDTSEAFRYFPNDFQIATTFIPETELQHKDEITKKWYSDYFDY